MIHFAPARVTTGFTSLNKTSRSAANFAMEIITLFGVTSDLMRRNYEKQRNKIAAKLKNPKVNANNLPHISPLESHCRIPQITQYS
jgi:hypothetical protein